MKASQESKYDIVRGRLVNRDTAKVIPADEPVLVLRAQDKNAPALLRFYKKMCKDGNHKKVIQLRINQFVEWQRANKDKVKEPDSAKASDVKARMESE